MKTERFTLIALALAATALTPPAKAQSYGPYAKDVRYFTSGEFCQKANSPEMEMMFQMGNIDPSNYWRNTFKGWYFNQLTKANGDPAKVSQLRAAYSAMQKSMTRCGL